MREDRFQDKNVVVTGGNSGIGLAAAQQFAAEGARVMIIGRNQKTLDEALATLGEGHLAVRADMDNLDEVRRVVDIVKTEMGTVDALFASAGIAILMPFEEITEERWDRLMSINLKCPYFLTQALVPCFGPGSSVVYCSSIGGVKVGPLSSLYGASKAAMRHMTRSLACELADKGIRVNVLSPGPIDTPITGRSEGIDDPQAVQNFRNLITGNVPMKRMGTPDEAAVAAVFLASDEASFITGAEIIVDGGIVGTT
ncbi:glucose 1-dehydrogenase [Pseudomonas putida]|uniref:Glucose 1-dehydrogenase n=1 Tax=Pseudomonas putida TaxID=303 RepID=A0A4D6XBE0_PSEPU|nr:glucose 1-dehydrogenase [Pseudomonas putida]QCI13107.1 glucose 1-dehydrogenase [Pseudomonas putida]